MVKVAWFIHLFIINYYCFWFENFYSEQNSEKKLVNKQSTTLSTQKAKKKPAAQHSKIGQQTTS